MTMNNVRTLSLVVATALLWPAAARAQKPAPAAKPSTRVERVKVASAPSPQGFSVVLVLGEIQGSGGTDNVPAAARKALADMKDFLPYKSYRLLDTQWTLCCGHTATVTRLRGPEDQDYDLQLSPSSTGADGKWAVRFALREPASAVAPTEGASSNRGPEEIAGQKRELENRLQILRERRSEALPEAQRMRAENAAEIAEMERALNAARLQEKQRAVQREMAAARMISESRHGRAIIDTSFTMEIGETVVVGTSRLKGDKALIALLTAVPSTRNNTR
jgi:hypothetical protein